MPERLCSSRLLKDGEGFTEREGQRARVPGTSKAWHLFGKLNTECDKGTSTEGLRWPDGWAGQVLNARLSFDTETMNRRRSIKNNPIKLLYIKTIVAEWRMDYKRVRKSGHEVEWAVLGE